MQFVDKALARRLESCEEVPQVLYARAFQKSRPEVGAAEEEICGGHMVFAGLGSPIGRATGVGLDTPLTAADLDRIEQFYSGRKLRRRWICVLCMGLKSSRCSKNAGTPSRS